MTAAWLHSNMMHIIDKHGLRDRAVAITTDTPTVMRSMWAQLKNDVPGNEIIPCACHVLNLGMKDTAAQPHIKQLLKDISRVVSFFTRSTLAAQLLADAAAAKRISKGIEKMAVTRFATITRCADSLLGLEPAIKAVVVSPEYDQLRGGGAAGGGVALGRGAGLAAPRARADHRRGRLGLGAACLQAGRPVP